MRLVGVAVRRVHERRPGSYALQRLCQPEDPCEHLRAVPERVDRPAVQLALAESRNLGDPCDPGAGSQLPDDRLEPGELARRGVQARPREPLELAARPFGGLQHVRQTGDVRRRPDLGERHPLVAERMGGDSQHERRGPRREADRGQRRARVAPVELGRRVRAGDHEAPVRRPHQVHAPVGEHANLVARRDA